MMQAKDGKMFAAISVTTITMLLGIALSAALLPGVAFAAEPAFKVGALSTGAQEAQVATQSTLTTSAATKATKVKAAKRAYKRYLAAHPSIKYFRVANMGNGGVPVLLCSKQKPITDTGSTSYGAPTYFISVDVIVYDKAKSAKVKNIGYVTTGGSAYGIDYSKNTLCGYRVGGLHTFGVATVKNGRLSISGMFDNEWLPNLNLRHFSDYNPKSKTPLSESKALGKKGTEKQYRNLAKKYGYGKHTLKLYKNNASNRAKRI